VSINCQLFKHDAANYVYQTQLPLILLSSKVILFKIIPRKTQLGTGWFQVSVFSHVRIGFPINSYVEVSVQEYVSIAPGPLLGSDVVNLPASILSGAGQAALSGAGPAALSGAGQAAVHTNE